MSDIRQDRKPWLVISVLIVALVILAVTAYLIRTSERDVAQQDAASNAQGKKQVAGEGQQLADEVLAVCRTGGKDAAALSSAGLCGKASTTKENIDETVKATEPSSTSTTTTIVRRETLPRGTLLATIRDALTSTCGADGCRDGKNGTNGKDSTVPGQPGTAGQAGATGDTGAKGEKGETGDAGKDGDNGANGTDGRGIASLVCSSSFGAITFTLTLTDGTVQEFSCGSDPVDPDPEPTVPAE